jgi:hypothetical protein
MTIRFRSSIFGLDRTQGLYMKRTRSRHSFLVPFCLRSECLDLVSSSECFDLSNHGCASFTTVATIG